MVPPAISPNGDRRRCLPGGLGASRRKGGSPARGPALSPKGDGREGASPGTHATAGSSLACKLSQNHGGCAYRPSGDGRRAPRRGGSLQALSGSREPAISPNGDRRKVRSRWLRACDGRSERGRQALLRIMAPRRYRPTGDRRRVPRRGLVRRATAEPSPAAERGRCEARPATIAAEPNRRDVCLNWTPAAVRS